MKRVILDTNIYEFLLRTFDDNQLNKISSMREFMFYGNRIVRKELRNIPKGNYGIFEKKIRKLRNALLNTYDLITKGRMIDINLRTDVIADKYFIAYRASGGNIPKEHIINDFLIVASASISGIDIVVSEDKKSMLSDQLVNSIKLVNGLELLRNPKFIYFGQFCREIRRHVL